MGRAAGPAGEFEERNLKRAAIVRSLDNLYGLLISATAVYKGFVLVGHRRSIEVGHMFWALPGRKFADGIALTNEDRAFRVISAPLPRDLVAAQARFAELEAQHTSLLTPRKSVHFRPSTEGEVSV